MRKIVQLVSAILLAGAMIAATAVPGGEDGGGGGNTGNAVTAISVTK